LFNLQTIGVAGTMVTANFEVLLAHRPD
jgi:hypothetical protein